MRKSDPAEELTPARASVQAILDLQQKGSRIPRMRVRWLGYTEADDTWEPVNRLYEDVPSFVTAFLQRADLTPLQARLVPRAWAAIDACDDRATRKLRASGDAERDGLELEPAPAPAPAPELELEPPPIARFHDSGPTTGRSA